ncbi:MULTISPECIES: helix-turn-helix domain-containing protein [Clostridia]|uniref:helix-turn-helix domain-containing protein n=1 Tax=Clostridia TaxID=186801 RepID=UPI002ED0DF0E
MDKLMNEKQLSIRQVSNMTGISKSTIHNIMTGAYSPTMDTLEAIAKGLKVRFEDLYESDL